jgi:hypothetical protein
MQCTKILHDEARLGRPEAQAAAQGRSEIFKKLDLTPKKDAGKVWRDT